MVEDRDGELLYGCYKDGVERPPWAILLDHEKKTIVISVRGTLSLKDCLTDAIATHADASEVLKRWGHKLSAQDATKVPYSGHTGMLRAAEHIRHELHSSSIVSVLLRSSEVEEVDQELVPCHPSLAALAGRQELPDCTGWSVLTVGHSLGAGVAGLLAVLLKPTYASTRAIAYSCPGAAGNYELAKLCEGYVTTVLVGDDFFVRASLRSLDELRDNVVELLSRTDGIKKGSALKSLYHTISHNSQVKLVDAVNSGMSSPRS